MIEERSAIGGSSEVEEVEYWVGLREAIQRASEALKGQTGVGEALLMEAGCVLRRWRRPALLGIRLGWRIRHGFGSCCRVRRAMGEVPGDGGKGTADRRHLDDSWQRRVGGRLMVVQELPQTRRGKWGAAMWSSDVVFRCGLQRWSSDVIFRCDAQFGRGVSECSIWTSPARL